MLIVGAGGLVALGLFGYRLFGPPALAITPNPAPANVPVTYTFGVFNFRANEIVDVTFDILGAQILLTVLRTDYLGNAIVKINNSFGSGSAAYKFQAKGTDSGKVAESILNITI